MNTLIWAIDCTRFFMYSSSIISFSNTFSSFIIKNCKINQVKNGINCDEVKKLIVWVVHQWCTTFILEYLIFYRFRFVASENAFLLFLLAWFHSDYLSVVKVIIHNFNLHGNTLTFQCNKLKICLWCLKLLSDIFVRFAGFYRIKEEENEK